MAVAWFSCGRCAQLRIGYRLPPVALDLAQKFADRFLPGETTDIPQAEQGSLQLFPSEANWVQCSEQDATRNCVNAILSMMRTTGKSSANADITDRKRVVKGKSV